MIDAIIERKRQEVKGLGRVRKLERRRPLRPFRLGGGTSIVGELKRRSPSAGAIGEIDDRRIEIYSRYAKAISVLTDGTYFGGSFGLLGEVGEKTELPLLCKDFIIHETQIDLAWVMGADLVLLIVRILSRKRLRELYRHATDLGMACLVELHDREDLRTLGSVSAEIVGVNARNLDTLAIDLEGARELLKCLDSPVRVAESGIKSRKEIEMFPEANAFLVGEALMRAADLESTFRKLICRGGVGEWRASSSVV